jgi:hypothetical protein
MLATIRFAALAVSLASAIGLAAPASAAHVRHHGTVGRGYYPQVAPSSTQDYPHTFCCS